MKRYLKLLFAASIITLFNACETDVYDPEKIENTKDLVAPADFDWKTTQSLTYSYNPQIEMFARFKMKSSFHKTKRII